MQIDDESKAVAKEFDALAKNTLPAHGSNLKWTAAKLARFEAIRGNRFYGDYLATAPALVEHVGDWYQEHAHAEPGYMKGSDDIPTRLLVLAPDMDAGFLETVRPRDFHEGFSLYYPELLKGEAAADAPKARVHQAIKAGGAAVEKYSALLEDVVKQTNAYQTIEEHVRLDLTALGKKWLEFRMMVHPSSAWAPESVAYYKKQKALERVHAERYAKKDNIDADAKRMAEDYIAGFISKNIDKMALILKHHPDIKSITPHITAGHAIEGTFVFEFSNGDGFTVVNQIVSKTSKNGLHFYQFPTTFHSISKGCERIASMSEEEMVNTF